jgi:hypothetical protein
MHFRNVQSKNNKKIVGSKKYGFGSWMWWSTPIIPVTWEAEIRQLKPNPRQKAGKTPSQQTS